MTQTAIQFDRTFKRFSRGKRVRTLAELVLGWPRRLLQKRDAGGLLEHEFWAINDVSFEVRKGEMLGIVGPKTDRSPAGAAVEEGIRLPWHSFI